MSEVLLFHHALGLTRGVLDFAESLRVAGHVVHAPDLYDGRTFTDLAEGVAFADDLGLAEVVRRGEAAAEPLARTLVYAGFSLGVMPAQQLAQTRPGAVGALLLHAAVPPAMLGSSWPRGLPAQLHVTEGDEDADVCRELAEEDGAELFLYPGRAHLFAEPASGEYDEAAARLLLERVLAFLDFLDRRAG